jgi:CheY-like chemotaxis protein
MARQSETRALLRSMYTNAGKPKDRAPGDGGRNGQRRSRVEPHTVRAGKLERHRKMSSFIDDIDQSSLTLPGQRILTGRRFRILVVDDETAIVEYLAELLRAWGHAVLPICCNSLKSAKSVLEDMQVFKFDVAIVGTVMPVMDGAFMIERLKELSPATRAILAIETMCIEAAEWLQAKGIDVQCLPAPFEWHELQQLLAAASTPIWIKPAIYDVLRISEADSEFLRACGISIPRFLSHCS